MTEEKKMIKEHIVKHSTELVEKLDRMFSKEMTMQEMMCAADIMKDISKAMASFSKMYFYDTKSGESADKMY